MNTIRLTYVYNPRHTHGQARCRRTSIGSVAQSFLLKALENLTYPNFEGVNVRLPPGGYRDPLIKLRLNGRTISKQEFDSSSTQLNWMFDTP